MNAEFSWLSINYCLESILISNPCNMYHIYARSTFKTPAELLWCHSLWSRLNFRLGIQVELWQLQNRYQFLSYFFLTFLQRVHLFNTIDSKYLLGNRLSRLLHDIYDFCKRCDVKAEIQILNWLQVHLVKQNYFESMTNYYSRNKISSIVLLNLIKIIKNVTKFLD